MRGQAGPKYIHHAHECIKTFQGASNIIKIKDGVNPQT